MSRPKPKILASYTHPKSFRTQEVLESDAIYAVFYKGKPINVRTANSVINYPGPKYKRVAFPSAGHAFNLAEKLNALFKTDQFQVYKLSQGEVVTESNQNDH